MTDDTEPLDPDIRSMLETALPMTAVPEPLRDRILSKVEARIALLPAGDAAFRPSHAEPVGPRGGSAWIASHPWLAVGAALVVGGAFGAAVKSASQGERVVYVERSANGTESREEVSPGTRTTSALPAKEHAPPTASETVPVDSLPAAASALPSAGHVSRAETSGENAGQRQGERLAAESAVLDVARSALAAGDGERAREAVERHAATFPRGLLREEREALGIRALLALGRVDEARARFTEFQARYPESLFLPAVESAMRKSCPVPPSPP